jgi:hypothetical protein
MCVRSTELTFVGILVVEELAGRSLELTELLARVLRVDPVLLPRVCKLSDDNFGHYVVISSFITESDSKFGDSTGRPTRPRSQTLTVAEFFLEKDFAAHERQCCQ